MIHDPLARGGVGLSPLTKHQVLDNSAIGLLAGRGRFPLVSQMERRVYMGAATGAVIYAIALVLNYVMKMKGPRIILFFIGSLVVGPSAEASSGDSRQLRPLVFVSASHDTRLVFRSVLGSQCDHGSLVHVHRQLSNPRSHWSRWGAGGSVDTQVNAPRAARSRTSGNESGTTGQCEHLNSQR